MTIPKNSGPTGSVVSEVIPRRARLIIYLIATLGALALSLWQAAEGNMGVFAASLFSSLATLLAASNLTPPGQEQIPPE